MSTNNGFTSINFDEYFDSLGIDWLEVEIRLNENSNSQTIRKILMAAGELYGINIPEEDDGKNATFVKPIYSEENPDLGSGALKVFRVRLHDVERKQQVLGIIESAKQSLRNLTQPKEMVSIKFTAIEIFRDHQSKDKEPVKANENNVSMLEYLYKFLRNPANKNHRFGNLYGAEAVPFTRSTFEGFNEGKPLYIGSQKTKKDLVSQRLYNKQTNRGIQLSPEEYRARYEVTLQDDGMPFTTVEEFKTFKCEKVAKHLYLNKLSETTVKSSSPLSKLMIERFSRIGGAQNVGINKRKEYTAANGKKKITTWTNKFSSSVVADLMQNNKIKHDLENLTKRLNTGLTK